MRAILRALAPCAIVALAASCDTSRLVAPSQGPSAGLERRGTIRGTGGCPKDSKLLNGGPTSVFGEGAGTWWGLEITGSMRPAW